MKKVHLILTIGLLGFSFRMSAQNVGFFYGSTDGTLANSLNLGKQSSGSPAFNFITKDGGSSTLYMHSKRWGGNYYWSRESDDGIDKNIALLNGDASRSFFQLFDASQNINVQFNTNGYSYFNGGNVGIGTSTPENKLHIEGGPWTGITIKNPTTTGGRGIKNQYLDGNNDGWVMLYGGHYDGQPLQFIPISNGVAGNAAFSLLDNGNVGIGTSSPTATMHVKTTGNGDRNLKLENTYRSFELKVGGYDFAINDFTDNERWFYVDGNNNWAALALDGGNVGIGTTNPQNKLDVLGTIRATEVKVETGWSDFVFEPDYKLPTLTEVENHIKEHGHLPDIPSAEEVKADGISLGEMNARLLQKIEELTLYTLEQEKKLEAKSLQLEAQNERLEELEAKSSQLKSQNALLQELLQRIEKLEEK